MQGLPNEVQFGEETRRELPVGVVYRLETWNYEEVRIIYAIYLFYTLIQYYKLYYSTYIIYIYNSTLVYYRYNHILWDCIVL